MTIVHSDPASARRLARFRPGLGPSGQRDTTDPLTLPWPGMCAQYKGLGFRVSGLGIDPRKGPGFSRRNARFLGFKLRNSAFLCMGDWEVGGLLGTESGS